MDVTTSGHEMGLGLSDVLHRIGGPLLGGRRISELEGTDPGVQDWVHRT